MQSGMDRGRAGAQHLSNDKVKQIQEALKSKGFDPGAADGVIGPKTSQAIRDFQKSENLQVTGRVDEKTAKALGVEAAGMSGSTSSSMGRSTTGSDPSGRQQESGRPSGSPEEKTGAREPAKGLGGEAK
jgi:peptidoglycan hydrolase-like protein with peptidoglycan-binding domain